MGLRSTFGGRKIIQIDWLANIYFVESKICFRDVKISLKSTKPYDFIGSKEIWEFIWK
jgi:hypothetical protein